MKKIIILGGGGFAGEVLDTIDEINQYTTERISPLGFLYDGGEKEKGKVIDGLPVLGSISNLKEFDLKEFFLIVPIGRTIWRRKVVKEAIEMGGKFINIIHPSTRISKWCKIGEGCIIQGQCIFTPDMKIGDFFVCNDNVSIGHETVIGDFVHINPNVNIAGSTKIGNDVFIGVKATILPSNIGDGAVIGACALITKDVPPYVLAKGIPAKYFEMEEKKY